jgi:hypothetical protein
VDRIIRDPWSTLTVTLPGAGPVDARSDLHGGVVSADGMQVRSAGAPAAAAPPVAAPVESAPEAPTEQGFSSFSLAPEPEMESPTEPEAEPEPEREPLPIASATAAIPVVATSDGGTTVQGIACSRQHFNDPAAVYCAICGISMVHQTHNLVPGIRPPLGVLVLDDGAVHTVDRDYVLGREPDDAPEVTSGAATALTLDDPDVTMSRVHSRLQLIGWEAQLVDAGSANGTYVAKAGAADWTRLQPGEISVLLPGTRIALGGRTMVFDSHHKL